MQNQDNDIDSQWSDDHEMFAKLLYDKADCYRYLHSNNNMSLCEYILNIKNLDIISDCINTIIFIVLGTTSCENKTVLILIASVINMINILINTYIKIASNGAISEMDRISYISWDRLAKNIRMELKLEKKDRKELKFCLKTWQNEFDRIIESSPLIKNSTINNFYKIMKMPDSKVTDNNIIQYFRLKMKVESQLDPNTNVIIPYKQFINNLSIENSDEDTDTSNL